MEDDDFSHFRSRAALRTGLQMWQIIPPILIVVGTIGNILSIMVLCRPNMRKSSYSVFLLGLAVADMCMLYIGLLRQWIKYLFNVDVRFTSIVVCKIHTWLVYTNADVCAWILTSITVERLISTLCPTKMKLVCTVRNAKIILVILLFILVAVNAHILYGFGVREITARNQTIVLPCTPTTAGYADFYANVWSWVDLCKASVVPFAILSFGNACIIWKLFQSRRRTGLSGGPSRHSMSKLLIALNFVFIVCTAPVCVYFIGDSYWIPDDVPKDVQTNDPVWALVNLLLYTNNTVNFFLYCISGSRFRDELKKMFTGIANNLQNTSVRNRSSTSSGVGTSSSSL